MWPYSTSIADVRRVIRRIGIRGRNYHDLWYTLARRFQSDRQQIERLKSEIRSLKAELAEAKRELKAVSPHASSFLEERRTKRKQYKRDYRTLDLQPVRTKPKGLLMSE